MEGSFNENRAIRLGRDKNTPADVLKTLAGKSDKVDRLIAKHLNADSTVLGALSESNDKTVIGHLLVNPNTPVETILAIASRCPDGCCEIFCDFFKKPEHEALAIRLAKDKKTSSQSLSMLMELYTSVDRLIAKHPNVDSRDLRVLSGSIEEEWPGSKDKVTRRNAFMNPNASGYTVSGLAHEFPDKFIKHPLLNWLTTGQGQKGCWDGPGLIYRVGQPLLLKILVRWDCPPVLLDWACKHGGALEQLAVWKNPRAPTELFAEMLKTGYAQEANVYLAHPEKLHEFASDLGFIGTSEELRESSWFFDMGVEASDLWKELVPEEGEAETIQGEMIRAIGRIKGDYYRNGFGNWFPFYFDFAQFLATHLIDENTFKPFTLSVLRADLRVINQTGNRTVAAGNPYETIPSIFSADYTEEAFGRLDAAIVAWCKRHPELISYQPHGRAE